MRWITRIFVVAVLLFATAACEPSSQPTTTTSDVLPPPETLRPTSTTTTSPTTTEPIDTTPVIEGVLPDGTHFRAGVPGDTEAITVIGGDFSFMAESGPITAADVTYRATTEFVPVGYDQGVLQMYVDGWAVEAAFDPALIEELGEAAEEVVTRSVSLRTELGLPVVMLSSPFTWVGASPLIDFETFAITTGCDSIAVVCTSNHAVQILASPVQPFPPERTAGTFLETDSLRPVSDPDYLNPGPLDQRLSADLIWTGEEMIVWGGKQTRDGLTTLVDGAAFNPDTGEWRMLAGFPLDGPEATRAIWADGEVIVVSPNGTFGYDPEADTWRTIGSGVVPSEWHDRMTHIDGRLYVWARVSIIHELTVATGEWRHLEAPQTSASMDNGPYTGVLRELDGQLVVVHLEGSCSGRRLFLLGEDWVELVGPDLSTETTADCSTANQTASVGGTLVAWDDENHPTAVLSNLMWTDYGPIPLGDAEGASGPLPMGETHFLVPRWGEAAIFDSETLGWTSVALPGDGVGSEMVWTGDELLAWGIWGTFDAWRWSPPPGVIGGDDVS